MVEYGYMEDGYLHAVQLSERNDVQKKEDGTIVSRVISVDEQVKNLDQKFKPIDRIDESKLQCEEGYFVRVIPYDAGDRIAYKYETVFDAKAVQNQIQMLKDELTSSDYKVIKCYEASLIGGGMPYDVAAIHSERQSIRDRINELEKCV